MHFLVGKWDIKGGKKMQIIIRIIIPLLVTVVLGFFVNNITKKNCESLIKNLEEEHIIIRLPKIYLLIGSVTFLFCFICLFYAITDIAPIWVVVVFSVFLFIGFFIVLKTLVWKIDVFKKNDYFLYRTIFFKTHKIRYSECTGYKINENTLTIETNKKNFRVDSRSTNIEFLVTMLTRYKVKNQR